MAGQTNFPTALDTDSSLIDVTDGVSSVQAAHHNNLKESIKAIEAKVGIFNTTVPETLDYRLGHPTGGHRHDGASGQGQKISYADLEDAEGFGLFEYHPTFGAATPAIARARFVDDLLTGQLHGPQGTTIPTAWQQTYVYLGHEGDAGFAGHRYMEFGLNSFNPGGPQSYTKHFFFGGWGVVLPIFATSGLHATYSEKAQVYYDDVANKLKLWTGATWRSLAME